MRAGPRPAQPSAGTALQRARLLRARCRGATTRKAYFWNCTKQVGFILCVACLFLPSNSLLAVERRFSLTCCALPPCSQWAWTLTNTDAGQRRQRQQGPGAWRAAQSGHGMGSGGLGRLRRPGAPRVPYAADLRRSPVRHRGCMSGMNKHSLTRWCIKCSQCTDVCKWVDVCQQCKGMQVSRMCSARI